MASRLDVGMLSPREHRVAKCLIAETKESDAAYYTIRHYRRLVRSENYNLTISIPPQSASRWPHRLSSTLSPLIDRMSVGSAGARPGHRKMARSRKAAASRGRRLVTSCARAASLQFREAAASAAVSCHMVRRLTSVIL